MLIQIYCFLTTLKADRKAVSALEYALMGTLIAVAIVGSVAGLGRSLSNAFTTLSGKLP